MSLFAIVAVGILVGVAAVAAGAYGYLRSRNESDESVNLFRCPSCGQKLRYAASRAGRQAQCPRCRSRAVLPMQSADLGPSRVLVGKALRRVG